MVPDINVRTEVEKITAIFRRPSYMVLAVLTAVGAFSFYALLLNYSLLASTLGNGNISLFLNLVPTLVLGYVQTTTATSIAFTTAISLAIGVNVGLVVYRLLELSSFGREGASSISGMVLAVIAPACPACATAIFASAGLASFFALLPYGGTELKALSLLLLAGSAVWISTQIDKQYCDFC